MTVKQENILQVKDNYQERNMEGIAPTYPDVSQGLSLMEGVLQLEVKRS